MCNDNSEQEQAKTKENILNIHQRILAVMGDISYIKKGDKKVNNQYTFISHDSVTAALHPLFVKHGITCLTSVIDHAQDGNRTEVSILLIFTNTDDPNDKVEIQGFGHGIDPQDKGAGKAVSYAVKMLLLKTFMLETGDRDNEADSIDHFSEEIIDLINEIKNAEEKGDWAALSMLLRSGDNENWIEAWKKLDTHTKGKINKLTDKRNEYRESLNLQALKDDSSGVLELWDELNDNEKKVVWTTLEDNTKTYIKEVRLLHPIGDGE